MIPLLVKLLAIFCFTFCSSFANDPTPDQKKKFIRIAGSSTLYPFVVQISERFSTKNPKYNTPIVESIGTGGGFNMFCNLQAAQNAVDIVSASREIDAGELDLCHQNKISDIRRITAGLDAIVLAFKKDSAYFRNINLTQKDLFLALSEFVPMRNSIVKNPYKFWNEIRSDLPNSRIVIYGPSATSGTFDSLVKLAVNKYCMSMKEFTSLIADKDDLHKICSSVRHDGAFIEVGENDSIIIKKLELKSDALGIFGYTYYNENKDTIDVLAIENVKPSISTVQSSKYSLVRPLYLYYNADNFAKTEGLNEFLIEVLNASYTVDESNLTLIPFQTSKKSLHKL